jgi:hypothetical protein
VFADLGAGDFRQAAGSPTIDAGSVDEHIGAQDLDRGDRVQRAAIDIGADELPADPVVTPPTPPEDSGGGGGSTPPTADTEPPSVAIDRAPLRRSTKRRATFAFSANEPATFECSLDGRPVRSCTAPTRYRRLASGRHTFAVYATDVAGNLNPVPASYRWRVRRR